MGKTISTLNGEEKYQWGSNSIESASLEAFLIIGNSVKSGHFEIYSVRRESDNLVLTVGDNTPIGIIKSFILKEDTIGYASGEHTSWVGLKVWREVQPKEWEITAFRSVPRGTIWKLNKNGYYQKSNSVQNDLDSMLTKGYTCVKTGNAEIYSVRRLSDNVEFKVSDNIQSTLGSTKFPFKITNFILTDTIYAENNISEQAISILNIQKIERLFITEDNIDIFDENIELWDISTTNWDYLDRTRAKYFIQFKEFPTTRKAWYYKEKAEEYVLMNKPSLSINDVLKSFNNPGNSIIEPLKNLVKTKL